MTPDRLAELIDKVSHGYNLINSEAREVLEHFGVALEQRKRCDVCNGEGRSVGVDHYGFDHELTCLMCNGTGYEVRK